MQAFGWTFGVDRPLGDDGYRPVRAAPRPCWIPSARQLEALALVASGLTFRQVAIRMGIAEHTVSNHLDALRHRVGADNLPQAVAECILAGWLVPDYAPPPRESARAWRGAPPIS